MVTANFATNCKGQTTSIKFALINLDFIAEIDVYCGNEKFIIYIVYRICIKAYTLWSFHDSKTRDQRMQKEHYSRSLRVAIQERQEENSMYYFS